MACIPQRLSSWPVRRERQGIAAAANMCKIEGWFHRLEVQLNELQSKLQHFPPGLEPSCVSIFADRLDRLETLFICTPNKEVDDVLSEMLARKSAQAAWVPLPTGTICKEPECETSPLKAVGFDNASETEENEDMEKVDLNKFDIFEPGVDAEVQTDSNLEGVGCQEVASNPDRWADEVDSSIDSEGLAGDVVIKDVEAVVFEEVATRKENVLAWELRRCFNFEGDSIGAAEFVWAPKAASDTGVEHQLGCQCILCRPQCGRAGAEVIADQSEDDAEVGQREIDDDPALDDFLGALADAAIGILDKETLKMKIKIFTNKRVAEGDDRRSACAEVKSLIKACRGLKVGDHG
jgi:hypothetical protein